MRYYVDTDETLIPIFTDLRANFMYNNISPYFSFGVGCTFNATYDFEGVAFLLNPSAGVSFKAFGRSSINVGLGYEM